MKSIIQEHESRGLDSAGSSKVLSDVAGIGLKDDGDGGASLRWRILDHGRTNAAGSVLGLLLVFVLCWQVRAQVSTAFTIPATIAAQKLGVAMVPAGDVDGDGHDDILASPGRYYYVFPGPWAHVYSGVDGRLLLSLNHNSTTEGWGCSLAALGDIDGDGFDDVAVGALGDSSVATEAGAVRAYSGATGGILYTLTGAAALDQFGTSMCTISDLDGDGLRDLVVGIPGSDVAGTGFGEVGIYSAATGATILNLYGTGSSTFGLNVEAVGDMDGDGIEDLAVGMYEHDIGLIQNAGEIRIFSGLNGSVIRSFFGTDPDEYLGARFTKGDDIDGDGIPEIFVGQPQDSPGAWMPESGRISCRSGMDGSMLFSSWGSRPYEFLASLVRRMGDFDGDGLADLAVTFSGIADPSSTNPYSGFTYTGGVRIYSSSNLDVLAEMTGDSFGDGLGSNIVTGDFNNDGIPDIAAGAVGVYTLGSRSGSIRVFSGEPRTSVSIGGGQPNSLAAEFLVNDYGTGTVKGPFSSTVQRGQTFSLDFRGAPNSLVTLYWSPLLNPGGWIFTGFGSFDLGTGPTFTDVQVAFDGFAGGFPYYGTNALGRFQQTYLIPMGWPTGPFVNLQALVQHEQPWFTWATITAAHQLVVQ